MVFRIEDIKAEGKLRLERPGYKTFSYIFRSINRTYDRDADFLLRQKASGGKLSDFNAMIEHRAHCIESRLNGMIKPVLPILDNHRKTVEILGRNNLMRGKWMPAGQRADCPDVDGFMIDGAVTFKFIRNTNVILLGGDPFPHTR